MSGSKKRSGARTHVGIDVSMRELYVAIQGDTEVHVFGNNRHGHDALLSRLTKRGRSVRVVVEATGTYHLDLAIALADHKRCEVMVANPLATKQFHGARGVRAKTDAVDAASLLEFAQRMDFEPWQRPAKQALELRGAIRYRDQLVKDQTRLKNQLHAAAVSDASPPWVVESIRGRLDDVAVLIKLAEGHMVALVQKDEELLQRVETLETIPGVGKNTAIHLVGELMFLDRTMTAGQLTAWTGLDPRPRESGTSVRGNRAISKRGNARLRTSLYMPALTSIRSDGPLKQFYERVVERTQIKMKGVVAVMRKLLITAWAIFRSGEPWAAAKASPKALKAPNAA